MFPTTYDGFNFDDDTESQISDLDIDARLEIDPFIQDELNAEGLAAVNSMLHFIQSTIESPTNCRPTNRAEEVTFIVFHLMQKHLQQSVTFEDVRKEFVQPTKICLLELATFPGQDICSFLTKCMTLPIPSRKLAITVFPSTTIVGFYLVYSLYKESETFARFWRESGARFFADWIEEFMSTHWISHNMKGMSSGPGGVNILRDCLSVTDSVFIVNEMDIEQVKHCVQPFLLLYDVHRIADSSFLEHGHLDDCVKKWLNRALLDMKILRVLHFIQESNYSHCYPHYKWNDEQRRHEYYAPDPNVKYRFLSSDPNLPQLFLEKSQSQGSNHYEPIDSLEYQVPAGSTPIFHPCFGMEVDHLSNMSVSCQKNVAAIFKEIVETAECCGDHEVLNHPPYTYGKDARNDCRWLVMQLLEFVEMFAEMENLLWFASNAKSKEDFRKLSQVSESACLHDIPLACSFVRTVTCLFHLCQKQEISNLVAPHQSKFERTLLHLVTVLHLNHTVDDQAVLTREQKNRVHYGFVAEFLKVIQTRPKDTASAMLWFLGLCHPVDNCQEVELDGFFPRLKNILFGMFLTWTRRNLLRIVSKRCERTRRFPVMTDATFCTVFVLGDMDDSLFNFVGYLTDTNHDFMPLVRRLGVRFNMHSKEIQTNHRVRLFLDEWSTSTFYHNIVYYLRQTNREEMIPEKWKHLGTKDIKEMSDLNSAFDPFFELNPNITFKRLVSCFTRLMKMGKKCSIRQVKQLLDKYNDAPASLIGEIQITVSNSVQDCSSIPPYLNLRVTDQIEGFHDEGFLNHIWVVLDAEVDNNEVYYLQEAVSHLEDSLWVALVNAGDTKEEQQRSVELMLTKVHQIFYRKVIADENWPEDETLPQDAYLCSLEEMKKLVETRAPTLAEDAQKIKVEAAPGKRSDWCLPKKELTKWRQQLYDLSYKGFQCSLSNVPKIGEVVLRK